MSINLLVKSVPETVDNQINREQARILLNEGKNLKKGEVVIRMLKEWYELKSKKNE